MNKRRLRAPAYLLPVAFDGALSILSRQVGEAGDGGVIQIGGGQLLTQTVLDQLGDSTSLFLHLMRNILFKKTHVK